MYALEALGVRKTYGGVTALAGVNLAVRPGTVHALLGENGAGKSTLVKVITGAVRPDAGVLRLEGREVAFANTAEAARSGVAVVSQELSLFPDLDVLGNLFTMRELRRGPLVDRAAMTRRAVPVLEELGLKVSPGELLGNLTLAERQLVEIAKALLTEPRVLVLDEPTSALEAAKSERLLSVLRVLRSRKVAVVFVSHILQEVMDLCDEVTVLRDGKQALQSVPIGELDVPKIVRAMLGDKPGAKNTEPLPKKADVGGKIRLERVSIPGIMQEVSLVARQGEILGLTGIAGAGHEGVIEVLAGLRKPSAGRATLPGGQAAPPDLRSAIKLGVAYVSGDRKRLGLMLDKPLWENIAQVRTVGLARDGVFLNTAALRTRAQTQVQNLGIRTASVEAEANSLSGGNQQKVVLAKWLEAHPTILLLDDPTRGVDVGAKAEIHALLRRSAGDGANVLLCSTDLDEMTELCDRVLVFFHGQVCAELSGETLNPRTLLEAMNTGSADTLEASA
jgi:ABC-type sugar transport system ATPase subunit